MPPKKRKLRKKKVPKNIEEYASLRKAVNISNDISGATILGTILLYTLAKSATYMAYLIRLRERNEELRRIMPDGLRGAIRENIEDELSRPMYR